MGAFIINRILNFHNDGHSPLHKCCTSLLSHQQYLAVPISLHTCQHVVSAIFFIFASLKGEKWHLIFLCPSSFGNVSICFCESCLLVTCISFLFFFRITCSYSLSISLLELVVFYFLFLRSLWK